MMGRALVVLQSIDLVEMCILGNVKYCFVLWSGIEKREA
jgi:hypothetical protein